MHEYQGDGTSAAQVWAPNIGCGGTRPSSDSERVLALDDATQQLADTNDHLQNIASEFRVWLDDAIGSAPQPANTGAGTPTSSGRMFGLKEHIRETRQLADALRAQLSRLQSI